MAAVKKRAAIPCVIQAGTRYFLKSPTPPQQLIMIKQMLYAVLILSKSFPAVIADVRSCYSTVRLL